MNVGFEIIGQTLLDYGEGTGRKWGSTHPWPFINFKQAYDAVRREVVQHSEYILYTTLKVVKLIKIYLN
jgi:hypothetical protein